MANGSAYYSGCTRVYFLLLLVSFYSIQPRFQKISKYGNIRLHVFPQTYLR